MPAGTGAVGLVPSEHPVGAEGRRFTAKVNISTAINIQKAFAQTWLAKTPVKDADWQQQEDVDR